MNDDRDPDFDDSDDEYGDTGTGRGFMFLAIILVLLGFFALIVAAVAGLLLSAS